MLGIKFLCFLGGFRRIFSLFCWFTHVEKGNLFLFFAFSFTSFSSLEVSTLCTSTADSLPFNAISPEPDAEEIKQYAVFSKYNFNSKKFKYYIQMSLEKKKKFPFKSIPKKSKVGFCPVFHFHFVSYFFPCSRKVSTTSTGSAASAFAQSYTSRPNILVQDPFSTSLPATMAAIAAASGRHRRQSYVAAVKNVKKMWQNVSPK